MNKNALIVLAVIVVVVVGLLVLFRGKDNNSKGIPQTSTPAAQKANNNTGKINPEETLSDSSKQSSSIVTYTDSGFSPSSLTIKNGQTVTFKNESSGDMWVASAPHPTHTDYPEFDAKKSYSKGESYSLIFTRIGTWRYHNHMKPSNFGSVTVE